MTTPRDLERQQDYLRPPRRDGGVDLNLEGEDVEGKYASSGEYYILTKVGLDFHTGESTANLVELSPIDLDFDADTPPPDRVLKTQNLDIDLRDNHIPEIKAQSRREQYIGPEGTTYRTPKTRPTRPRGGRDMGRRR